MKDLTIEEVYFNVGDAIINDNFPGFREDYLVIHSLLKKFQPKTIFEIGTSTGTGTRIIKNAVKSATVYSLDLPESECDNPGRVGVNCDLEFIQFRGDSLKFRYQDYPCEAYFIDGCHDFEHPFNESIKIISLNPKLIIYHDADLPEVMVAIEQAFHAAKKEYSLFRVTGTRIAYAVRNSHNNV